LHGIGKKNVICINVDDTTYTTVARNSKATHMLIIVTILFLESASLLIFANPYLQNNIETE